MCIISIVGCKSLIYSKARRASPNKSSGERLDWFFIILSILLEEWDSKVFPLPSKSSCLLPYAM
ncbi:hypothetical protein VCRA2114O369_100085 [Vibrio crassostreae]|nr:hypothetical protein VCRA2114O369_100085 [Vibrio crassostreae]CAK1701448.1 hypothetical protein VCRA2113O359_100089 [Vibrio crassostreae]CAK1722782.1 hypothetical protein VCRA2113O358_110086 [Vibrio crassostreae]CAK2246456.1 hypothetical protein VCRA2113O354_90088 [Vibrio crassostreae]CAK3422760.1 hypothetical protein VCRA2123O396_30233 [Vibrio crassostreae]